MKCCEDCCECQCHRDGHIGVRGDIRFCKCSQPEFKKDDWVIHNKGYGILLVLNVISNQVKCVNTLGSYYTLMADCLTSHTLTKDDLCPCPYCGGEVGIVCEDNAWTYCKNTKCKNTTPYQKTETLAVADVLLLKIRMDREL